MIFFRISISVVLPDIPTSFTRALVAYSKPQNFTYESYDGILGIFLYFARDFLRPGHEAKKESFVYYR